MIDSWYHPNIMMFRSKIPSYGSLIKNKDIKENKDIKQNLQEIEM